MPLASPPFERQIFLDCSSAKTEIIFQPMLWENAFPQSDLFFVR